VVLCLASITVVRELQKPARLSWGAFEKHGTERESNSEAFLTARKELLCGLRSLHAFKPKAESRQNRFQFTDFQS
jgi:hypothetical protein